jgi:hypothetical protein
MGAAQMTSGEEVVANDLRKAIKALKNDPVLAREWMVKVGLLTATGQLPKKYR